MPQYLKDLFDYGYNALYIVTAIVAIFAVLRRKGDPSNTIGWLLVIALFPIGGVILYLLFGINYRRKNTFYRRSKDTAYFEVWREHCMKYIQEYGDASAMLKTGNHAMVDVANMLINTSYSFPTLHNTLKIYTNGTQKFEALFQAIKEARMYIHVEYYILNSDTIGNQLADLLIEKAKEGVEVRVLYDNVGSWGLDRDYVKRLSSNGVEIKVFSPIKFSLYKNKINFRNHRKIVVIDGKCAFTGGMNVADRYLHGMPELGIWRDTHLKLEGESVSWLQLIFLNDWYLAAKKLLTDEKYFTNNNPVQGNLPVQIISSGPDAEWSTVMYAYFAAINGAQKSICIATPYFIPNSSILTAIRAAALRGVEIYLLLSRKSDSKLTHFASMAYIDELLNAGVKIYFYTKGFIHSKFLLIDSAYCSVGTANMDIRSFDQNYEVNALIYDEDTTCQLEDIFEQDLLDSVRVTQSSWDARPRWRHLAEGAAKIFAPIL